MTAILVVCMFFFHAWRYDVFLHEDACATSQPHLDENASKRNVFFSYTYVYACARRLRTKGAVTLGNFSCNLSRNCVAPLQHKLHESLPSVTCPDMNLSRNVFVAGTIAQSRPDFYFSQLLQQQKNCETCSFQGMVH